MGFQRVVLFVTLTVLTSTASFAQTANCDIELFRAKQDDTTSDLTDLFQLQLIDNSNYETAKRNASAKYSSYFSGDYSSFNEKRSKAFSESQFRYQRAQSRHLVSSSIDDNALAAYKACLRGTSPLTALMSKSPSARLVTIRVAFNPNSAPPRPNPLEIKFFGAKQFGSAGEAGTSSSATVTEADMNAGEKTFMFERQPGEEFVAIVQMPSLNIVAGDLALPAPPKVRIVTEVKGLAARGNASIDQPPGAPVGKSWGPSDTCVSAEPGWTIVDQSESIVSVPDGPNGPCVSARKSTANESSLCYSVSLSINAGQVCNASWTVQARQKREVRVFE